MKPIDAIALKYITSQAKLNEMIRLNKEQADRIETLIAMNKNLRSKPLSNENKNISL